MGPINSVSCSISSRLLAAGDENGYVHVWELKNRDLLKSFKVSLYLLITFVLHSHTPHFPFMSIWNLD